MNKKTIIIAMCLLFMAFMGCLDYSGPPRYSRGAQESISEKEWYESMPQYDFNICPECGKNACAEMTVRCRDIGCMDVVDIVRQYCGKTHFRYVCLNCGGIFGKKSVTTKPEQEAVEEHSFTLEKDDGLAWMDAERYLMIAEVPAYVPEAVFFGDNGEEVGKLSWEGGVFKFEGKAEESAKIFFDWLKVNIDLECNSVKEKSHTSHKVDNRYDY